MALGVTQTLPSENMLNLSRERAHNFISFLMGGRVAEEIVFNEITNGASNDIERATSLARSMVCDWGMSEDLGPINLSKGGSGPQMYGQYAGDSSHISEETSQKIDKEISRIVKQNYELSKQILLENREALDRLSEALIIWETLDSEQIKKIMNGEDIGAPLMKEKKKVTTENVETPAAESGKLSPA
jgi:cell division protease FtsH